MNVIGRTQRRVKMKNSERIEEHVIFLIKVGPVHRKFYKNFSRQPILVSLSNNVQLEVYQTWMIQWRKKT